MNKYFYKIIEEMLYTQKNFNDINDNLNNLYNFLIVNYKYTKLDKINKLMFEQFLFFKFSKDKLFNYIYIKNFFNIIFEYINKNYNLMFNFSIDDIIKDLKRINKIKVSTNKNTKNLIINKSPLIISFDKYKEEYFKKINQKSIYIVLDKFLNDYILIKNLKTNKFLKLKTAKNTINLICINDIILMKIQKQNQWIIKEIFKYYPFKIYNCFKSININLQL